MNMNWLNIKYIGRAGLIIILLFFTCPSSATCKTDTVINTYKRDSLYFAVKADSIIAFHTGDSLFTIIKADTVLPVIPKAVKRTGYDNRVHRFRKNWERIIPTHAKIQYAGNMGLLSFGTGWDYGKRNQWETDILLGFIPKYSSKKTKVTMTLKQNYMPWSINIGKGFSTEPLACGLYLNTVFGDQFWVNEPDRYPKGYYGFSSKVRIHIYMGQRLTYDIDPQRRFLAKSVTFFYEISTCDLYLVSAVQNSYLRPRDYLSLSFGLKFQYCGEDVEKEIMTQLPNLTVSRWNPYFADVNVADTNKASGMADIADYLGFSLDESMAFGDGGNDIPMLRAAGTGIAMGGASDLIKNYADYVTDDVDEDGIYNALAHFGII